MLTAAEETLALVSGPPPPDESTGGNSGKKDQIESDRLGFEVELLKPTDKNENGVAVRWRSRRTGRRRRTECRTAAAGSAVDMTVSRSCRCGLSVPVMFWTTVCLVLLASGVNSVSDEQTRFSRSKYEPDGDVQGGFNVQDTYHVMQFLRELIQRQQQRANLPSGSQVHNNGEDLSDKDINWRKIPLPLLYQIRSILNDGSKEEDKRGSYMSLCHFKICNLG